MNLETLKHIIKIAKEEGVGDLKVDTKDFKVEVRFPNGASTPAQVAPLMAAAPAPIMTPPQVAPTPKTSGETHLHVIKSPFVGTFYSGPAPGKPAYVKVGDKVKTGQALCVLEAMKIMNEIDADLNGEVVEICVENESLVEFGQPLFKIKPS